MNVGVGPTFPAARRRVGQSGKRFAEYRALSEQIVSLGDCRCLLLTYWLADG
jgi:hypothetical protein